jgi:hypothetical protein
VTIVDAAGEQGPRTFDTGAVVGLWQDGELDGFIGERYGNRGLL